MTPRRRALRTLALLLAAFVALGNTRCEEDAANFGTPFLFFEAPLPSQLSAPGELDWALHLSRLVDADSLEVSVVAPDGSETPVPAEILLRDRPGRRSFFSRFFPPAVEGAQGVLDASAPGVYQLRASAEIRLFFFIRFDLRAAARVETVALANADECEILNGLHCLLPYPSSRFLAPAATPSGFALNVPQVGIPVLKERTIPAETINVVDGFSPTVQVLMHFPGGVDPERSHVSRLLDEGSAPPWIDTRTHDDSSLDPSSPTLLLDWETGERILHWTENDARAADEPDRQLFILRPAVSLVPGRRYVVAVRDLVHADGTKVEAEPVFRALRDRRASDIPAVQARRDAMEEIFANLRRARVPRDDLQLAFDFVVQSEHSLTHQMLAMRDRSFEWLDEQVAADVQTFQVDFVEDFPDCATSGNVHRRIAGGTFQSPLFLEQAPAPNNVAQHVVDENDVPQQNGTMDAPFTISIPCAADDPSPPELSTLLLGHGIFGRGEGLVRGVPAGAQANLDAFGGVEWRYLSGATDWSGWSQPDLLWAGARIVGLVNSQLQNFPAFPDRHRQGQANTLVLSRMMKRGLFNRDPAFQLDGAGVFPEDNLDRHFYYGISMGGVQGLFHSALTPDIERLAVDVPGINFSLLLQRSTQFSAFETLIENTGLTDPVDSLVGFALIHELWVSADPAGYATHITENPLPGSIPKKILMTAAWLDHQVTNHSTEIAARTLGISSLHGSIQQGLVGIPDLAPGETADSALINYDSGSLDIRLPAHEPFIPPLANQIVPNSRCDPHGARPSIPAGSLQLLEFMQPDGVVANFCNGLCDAGEPLEIRRGDAEPCDPL